MIRMLVLSALLTAPGLASAAAAPTKCEAAIAKAMQCHQDCQDSNFDAAGLERCENACPSTPEGCADGTDKAPEK